MQKKLEQAALFSLIFGIPASCKAFKLSAIQLKQKVIEVLMQKQLCPFILKIQSQVKASVLKLGLEYSCQVFKVDPQLIEKIAMAEEIQEEVKMVENKEGQYLHIQQLNQQSSQDSFNKSFKLVNTTQNISKSRQLTPSKERLTPITLAMKKKQNCKCWQEVLQDHEVLKTKFDLNYKTKFLKSRGNHLEEIFRRSNRPKVSRLSFTSQKLYNSYNFMNQELREIVTKNKINLNQTVIQEKSESNKALTLNEDNIQATPNRMSQRAYTLINQIKQSPNQYYKQQKSYFVDYKQDKLARQIDKSMQSLPKNLKLNETGEGERMISSEVQKDKKV